MSKKNVFLGDLSQICLPSHPPKGFCEIWENKRWNFCRKKAIFGVIWGCFEGFGPFLGIRHPTHPHLGKFSQKKRFFYTFPHAKMRQMSLCIYSFMLISLELHLYISTTHHPCLPPCRPPFLVVAKALFSCRTWGNRLDLGNLTKSNRFSLRWKQPTISIWIQMSEDGFKLGTVSDCFFYGWHYKMAHPTITSTVVNWPNKQTRSTCLTSRRWRGD